jgi:hypothetical protein
LGHVRSYRYATISMGRDSWDSDTFDTTNEMRIPLMHGREEHTYILRGMSIARARKELHVP